jgi:hypothetical protein
MKRASNKVTFKMRGRALVAALAFLIKTFLPVPVEPRGKAGIGNWANERVTSENAAHLFNGEQNIALRLGALSRGLTDVDLDCPVSVVGPDCH